LLTPALSTRISSGSVSRAFNCSANNYGSSGAHRSPPSASASPPFPRMAATSDSASWRDRP
jgi:hypothetical protein